LEATDVSGSPLLVPRHFSLNFVDRFSWSVVIKSQWTRSKMMITDRRRGIDALRLTLMHWNISPFVSIYDYAYCTCSLDQSVAFNIVIASLFQRWLRVFMQIFRCSCAKEKILHPNDVYFACKSDRISDVGWVPQPPLPPSFFFKEKRRREEMMILIYLSILYIHLLVHLSFFYICIIHSMHPTRSALYLFIYFMLAREF